MVLIGGPRQVGKTTVALDILGGDEGHPASFNWDYADDRRILLAGALPPDQPLVVLDEIHKYKQWRNFIKGLYDKKKSRISFLITGSAWMQLRRSAGAGYGCCCTCSPRPGVRCKSPMT